MNHNKSDFIIYACPTGDLNIQIENYFNKAARFYGENQAHKYIPHCTLTGFFTDELSSTAVYLDALDRAYNEAKNNNLFLNIKIEYLTFNNNWHGLELKAEGLKQLIARFNEIENSLTRKEDIRLKEWLHLSLAYEFDAENKNKLQNLAIKTIDLKSNVNWELRFYKKDRDWTWDCLQSWVI